jgi:choice-of-anchor B domain-containing protein
MTSRRFTLALTAVALVVSALPGGGTASAQSADETNVPCRNGKAGQFLCKDMDLVAHIPASEMNSASVADVQGWVDPETDREYAVLGTDKGMTFFDVTSPAEPLYLGYIPVKAPIIWQEVEVLNNTAYAVCDLDPCGIQIFDLTRLRSPLPVPVWTPNAIIPTGAAHSIDGNPETNHLFINGPGVAVGTPLIFDVSVPLAPVPVGIIADDGYTHDSLCRNYHGPDKDHKDHEVCFEFNEDTITIYDVTNNEMQPEQLSRTTYDQVGYVHSGALTKDHSTLISTDETDEESFGIRSTLHIWDVRDLANPKLIDTYVAPSGSIDHNVYSEEDALYHANYVNGFRILDMKNAHKGKLKEVAYFDTMPTVDTPTYDGAWAAYPYLPSGNILVGDMSGQGLFIVKPRPSVYKSLGVKR